MNNKEDVLVSIIITNYNYGHYLADAIKSVIAQSFHQWECLIIDDGSTDNSKAVLAPFLESDSRFVYVYQHNQGLAAARNKGLSLAKGKYIQFLDADDKIACSKLSNHTAFLESHSEVDIVYSRYYYFETEQPDILFTSKNKHQKAQLIWPTAQGNEMLAYLLVNNFTVVSAPLLRRAFIEEHKITFDTSYNTFEDWRFWIDCALANASFVFLAQDGAETLIRFGHSSMMSALVKMNLGGQKIRTYLHPYLSGKQKLYNWYRMKKLKLKYFYLTRLKLRNE